MELGIGLALAQGRGKVWEGVRLCGSRVWEGWNVSSRGGSSVGAGLEPLWG